MFISGKDLSASKLQVNKEKYASYENNFQKLILKTTKGSEFNLKDVKQPIVVLNFWASWCTPCLKEFSALKQFVTKFPSEKVLVLGINNDDDEPLKAISKTEKDLALNFESVVDKDNEITSSFFISAIPASIVFKNGKVIYFANKEFDFNDDDFVNLIQRELKEE